MSALITFRGVTLLNANEGNYAFTPPTRTAQIIVESLPRSIGAVAKYGGQGPAEGSLEIRFAVTTANVTTIVDRVETMCADATPGTLVVPNRPAMTNCILTDPREGPQQPVTIPGVGAGYRMVYTFKVVRLR